MRTFWCDDKIFIKIVFLRFSTFQVEDLDPTDKSQKPKVKSKDKVFNKIDLVLQFYKYVNSKLFWK